MILCISVASTVVSFSFFDLGLLFFLSLAKGLSILFIFSKSQFFLQQLNLLIFGYAAHRRSLARVPGPQQLCCGAYALTAERTRVSCTDRWIPTPRPAGKLSPPVPQGLALADASVWTTLPPDVFVADSLTFFSSLFCSQSTRFIPTSHLATERVLSPPNPLHATSFSRRVWHLILLAVLALSHPPPLPSPCWRSASGAQALCWLLHFKCSGQWMLSITYSINTWWMKACSWFLIHCGPQDTTPHVPGVATRTSWPFMFSKSFTSFRWLRLFDITSFWERCVKLCSSDCGHTIHLLPWQLLLYESWDRVFGVYRPLFGNPLVGCFSQLRSISLSFDIFCLKLSFDGY